MKKQNSNVQNTAVQTAKQNARQKLKSLSNSLIELAKAEGRTDVSINELLREAYQLVGKQLKTFEA